MTELSGFYFIVTNLHKQLYDNDMTVTGYNQIKHSLKHHNRLNEN